MEKMILRESVVTQAIEQVLKSYSEYPYKQALANRDFRRTLVNHVLSQLQSQYTIIEEGQILSNNSDNLLFSQEQELSLKNLIRQEIAYLLQQKSECITRSSPEEAESCFTPSHWFG